MIERKGERHTRRGTGVGVHARLHVVRPPLHPCHFLSRCRGIDWLGADPGEAGVCKFLATKLKRSKI